MKKFISKHKNLFSILFLQILSICMFVLFLAFIYFPYEKIDFELFPFDIYRVSWKAFGYYTVIYLCIWVFVQLRLNILDANSKVLNFKNLIISDLLISILSIPFFFIQWCRVFGVLIIELAILLCFIDLMWNSKRNTRFLYVTILLFVSVNIVLLFVNWRNNLSQLYQASCIVKEWKEHQEFIADEDIWALAQYKNEKLEYSIGEYEYPLLHKFNLNVEGFNTMKFEEIDSHYLFKDKDVVYVVSCPAWHPMFRYLVNFTYVFTIYLIITMILYHLFSRLGVVMKLNRSFFSRLQYNLMLFMLGCMLLVLILISVYIGSKYERMSRNTQIYRTKLFINYMDPVFEENEDVEILQNKLDVITNVLKTKVVVYNSDKKLFLKSDNIQHLDKEIFIQTMYPFEKMKSNIDTKIKLGKNNVHMQSYTVLYDKHNKPLYIKLSTKLDKSKFDHEISIFIILMFNMYFIVLIISIAISYFIAKRMSVPLQVLETRMKNINFSGENEKLEYSYTEDDALAKLVDQYNILLDKLKEAAEQLAEHEREESWKNMARQIAHEIRNPLTPMRLLAQQMEYMPCDDVEEYKKEVKKSLKTILDCIDNVKSITDLLSDFAKTVSSNPVPVDLVEKVSSVVELFTHNNNDVEIKFKTEIDVAIICADQDMIVEVFNNLMTNAIQSIDKDRKGLIDVLISEKNNRVTVFVKDDGCGISEENLKNIFKVNFTTKVKGMGLGLCIVKNVIESSHGKIEVQSKENEGTTFAVSFPLMNKEIGN